MDPTATKPIRLEDFEREIRIRPLSIEDFDELIAMQESCFPGMLTWGRDQIESQLQYFPDGQVVVEYEGRIVASASSLIVDFDDYDEWQNWKQIADEGYIRNHDPEGDTLYGIEIMVHPDCRGLRLARRLYDERKRVAREKNVARIIIAGRIPGYGKHADEMTAREYVERHGTALTFADVEAIGRGQQAVEDRVAAQAMAQGASFLILDTDLVSTLVYSRHYYGDCPSWIEMAAKGRLADLYLLQHVDVAWLPDGHQREQPARRAELLASFRATLEGLGARIAHVCGSWGERERRAREAVDRFVAHSPGPRPRD